jgi:predicted aspartyl protease
MSPISRFNRFFVLLTLAICAPAVAAAQAQAEPGPQIVTAKIRLDDLSMIIVPVNINGSGPYDFLLDTGSSKTIVDRKLAEELGLPLLGEKNIVGVLAFARMSVVRVSSLSVAGAVVPGGEIFSSDHPATVNGKVRGVLGEDFLQNFDVLIDYRHQSLRLGLPLGSMAQTAMGEHLPLQLSGTYRGNPTHNRLVVSGRMREFGDAAMSLLLDSGANQLTLFQDNLGPGVSQTVPIATGNFNRWVASLSATRRIQSLTLGSNSVPELTVIALSRRADFDTDGLIPTSLFHSIFISSHGGFVILNPTFPKTSRNEHAAVAIPR